MKSRTWSLLSVLLLLAAALLWQKGEARRARQRSGGTVVPVPSDRRAPSSTVLFPLLTRLPVATPPASAAPGMPSTAATSGSSPAPTQAANPLRLSNTSKAIGDLVRLDTAVLLRNAFVDTANNEPLRVPAHLRAQSAPGAYIVQARGAIDDEFRAQLAASGATIVSYLPNNAYLVRAGEEAASQLAASPRTQAVLSYEPYYKLDRHLLPLAVDQSPMPENTLLNVVAFPGEHDATVASLGALGASILSEGRSPFGPEFVVQPTANSLIALAQLPTVQILETYSRRVPLNDVVRTRLGVTPDGASTNGYLGLSGQDILVNINDTGVDGEHPDLAGRVSGDTPGALIDVNGHGTHVAGTIAGSGAHSPTNLLAGSVPGANFQGMAPQANLYVLPVDLDTGPIQSDSYLQETAALTNYAGMNRTNAIVSNNSWGYPGHTDYDAAAASYDAAVRDALPQVTGSQPIIYVFAAGNVGGGNDAGQGGDPGSILSPATAKNVITVGASKSGRQLTYNITSTNSFTNAVTLEVTNVVTTNVVVIPDTDTDTDIATFSSRGNVGISLEGTYGRFKPDVVAPGAYVVSTRSKDWTADYRVVINQVNVFPNQILAPRDTNYYSIFVPDNPISLNLEILTNAVSAAGLPLLPIYIKEADFPTGSDYSRTNTLSLTPSSAPPLVSDDWFYSIVNPTDQQLNFDLRTTLKYYAPFDTNLITTVSNLDVSLGPYYRIDSGTSSSAAAVSGMLALMQEFFEKRLQRGYSPALFKALLINGARSLDPQYDFHVRSLINYQGWGLASLPNALPGALTNNADPTTWPLQLFDQSTNRALATGQTNRFDLALSPDGAQGDLRITLVWTDPPGNPNAATKLVNDLDLIVSNKVTGEVYVGNDIASGRDFNDAVPTNFPPAFDTNAPPAKTNLLAQGIEARADHVNNVENVYLRHPLGTNYLISVIGRRVNVNAVTAHPNGVVQDYALVVSVSDTAGTSKMVTVTPQTVSAGGLVREVTVVTNGVALLHQRVGANSPLQGLRAGITNQWHFYVFTNTPIVLTNATGEAVPQGETNNGPYVAFITFMPPNLAVPRFEDADIDMYVTRGPNAGRLTNLEPAALASALTSLGRGGSEVVAVTNSTIGEVFYIGIKAEDQQAAEYGFIGLSSNVPFEEADQFGNRILHGMPRNVVIPDGSPALPGAALVFAVGISPSLISQVTATEVIDHQELGDLLGNLSHNNRFVVLNNHVSMTNAFGRYVLTYDDSRSGGTLFSLPSDGPGSLRNFTGQGSAGSWMLTMVDNTLSHTGRVESLDLRVQPQIDLRAGGRGSVLANEWQFYPVTVPTDATNMAVILSQTTGPLDLYVRQFSDPTFVDYDKRAVIAVPGGILNLSTNDSPPLNPGPYIVGVFNPTAATVSYFIQVKFGLGLQPNPGITFTSPTNAEPRVLDDATTNATIFVQDGRPVVRAEVGVRIDHPRVSDLVLHLVSPEGTRLLLAENRGGLSPDGYGASITNLLVSPRTSSGGPQEDRNVIETFATSGTIKINYNFYDIPDVLRIYYDGARIYDSGLVNGTNSISVRFGPGQSTKITIVVNEGGSSQPTTAWTYTASVVTEQIFYTIFTDDTNKTTIPIKFAPTPFTPGTNGARILFSSFEGAAVGDYDAGQTVDGWLVGTNFVSVVTGGAQTGTNYLSAIDSVVSRTLPTLGGKRYILTFAYRNEAPTLYSTGVDDNKEVLPDGAVDPHYELVLSSSGGPFGPRYGPQAYVVNESALPMFYAPNTANSKWIAPTASALFRIGSGLFIYRTGFSLRGYSLPTVSVLAKLAVDFQLTDIIVNGKSLGVNYVGSDPLSPVFNINTNFLRGANIMDFVVTNRGGETAFRAEMSLNGTYTGGLTNRPSQITLGGVTTNNLVSTNAWVTNAIAFIAPSDGTPLTVSAGLPGLRLDSFTLYRVDSTYYLPEEPLSPLVGQSAAGTWQLEITDNRVGATNPIPFLGAWELNLLLAHTNPPALALTNGQCIDGVIPPLQMVHFAIDVPLLATHATNSLQTSNNLALFFNQGGISTGGGPGDVLLLPPGNTYVLSTNGTPQLVPGQRYYLGLTNQDPSVGANFTFCVHFDRTDDALLGLPALTNGVVTTNTIQPGLGLDYYQYTVTNSTDLIGLLFQLFPTNGDVDLFIKKAATVPDPLPTPNNYDFASTNAGTLSDSVFVTANDVPPVSQGVWYIGVLNKESFPVTYGLEVSEFKTNFPPTITELTNGIPVNSSVSLNPIITNYFHFAASNDPPAIQFDVQNLTAPAQLVVAFGKRPTSSTYDFWDFGAPGAPSRILVRTNANWPSLTGDWYLAVIDRGNADLKFTIEASIPPTNTVITVLTNAIWVTNTIPANELGATANIDYYRFTVTPDALLADFELQPANGNVDLVLAKGQLPTPASFDARSLNPGRNAELIRLRVGDPPPALSPGDWYLGVYGQESLSVTYRVRATAQAPQPFVLIADSAHATTITNGTTLDYYAFTPSATATNALFSLTASAGNLGLYIHDGLPLPDPGVFDYAALTVSGVATIVVATNSQPPLTTNTWYLSVTNMEAVPVTYTLLVKENSGALVSFRIDPKIIISGNTVTFTWAAPPGLNFQVQYAAKVTGPWANLGSVVTSTNGVYSFTDDLSAAGSLGASRFYRVVLLP